MKNRILRSALSVALCAAMLLSQGLTAFADGEIVSRALETSPEYIQEMFQGPLKHLLNIFRRQKRAFLMESATLLPNQLLRTLTDSLPTIPRSTFLVKKTSMPIRGILLRITP